MNEKQTIFPEVRIPEERTIHLRRWTYAEERKLIRSYNKGMPHREIASMLKRTIFSVRSKVSEMLKTSDLVRRKT